MLQVGGEFLTQREDLNQVGPNSEIYSKELDKNVCNNLEQCYFDPLKIQALAPNQFGGI